ncbi:MAG: MMPL family transporter [Methylococcaceae bacterium]|nr:MMPL family transporter [Methylococcaceae bacterium]MDP2393817.1 MMPL family transporter [Methylococcaceae bacterium]MDP3019843.1 MMPL family transporter [Methylococcaceae bacterium]MDP3389552.1 MMPL family transporter [Methylococcaceae bacterium]MDZ4156239.1 MMPL family transporter [Methylococcales bacterium]
MKINHSAAKIAEYFARNPKKILGVALFFSILAGWATAQLPIHTSRQALLPQNTTVANRFNHFLENFGAASDLMIVLEGAPRSELESFANDLAAKLQVEPEIGLATSRLDMAFFLNHAYLLMPLEGLDKLAEMANQPILVGVLEENLRKAVTWSKDHPQLGGADTDLKTAEASLNLVGFFLEEWQRWLTDETVPVGLEWNRLLANSGASGMNDGYFTSRDGRMLFLFVHPKNASGDFQNLEPFVDKVKQVSATLTEQVKASGQAAPIVGLTGLPAIEYEEFVNIRKDITLVIFTSAGLIAALILLVVRSVRWAVLIFVPMGLGVLWSLGLALITVGHLTIITAAFIAILFGLGADYGIFTTSRIDEERRAGKPLVEAIGAGIGSSFIAVLTAGGASLLIFSALATVDFPGFSELGVVAAKGVLMILISTWMVQPALYALLPPKLRDITPSTTTSTSQPQGDGSGNKGRFPLPVAVVIVLLALGCAVIGGMKGLSIPFDYDVLSMLPKDSQAAYYQRRMVAESDYQSEVIIFTAKDMKEARRITTEAGKLKTIAQAQSLTNLFPEDADARLHKAISLGKSFSKAGYDKHLAELSRAGLSVKSFELLRALLENSTAIIDDAEEQAFSAGHTTVVESLERVRGQLSAISGKLAADSEQGRVRSENFLRALLFDANAGLNIIEGWQQAQPLSPEQLPPALRNRFFGADGSIAIYGFPAKTVYDPDNLDALINDVYSVSPEATGFPTTHQAFSKAVVASFTSGTQLALILCLLWVMAATRSVRGFALAALPLLIGGGWMLGLMALGGIRYNYANIVALPMVIALAVDYGVWFSYRWRELKDQTPLQVSMAAGKVIGLAAGTELAGLGAITLASYRGVSSLGVSITIGLVCCLVATLVVAPAIGQLLDSKRKP